MSTDLVPIQDIERMAEAVAKSQLFGMKTKEQAMALMLLCQAENLHPMVAVRDFDIIQNRPAKKAEAMQRSFQSAGGKIEWHQMDDERADATFSHPQGGTIRISWDMARAKKAGLTGKDNYMKYPRQMLSARVISEGCRKVWPAATSGVYTPEETRAIVREEKDVTPKREALPATVDTTTGEVHEPAPTSDLLPRIAACKTVAEVEALRPEVAKLPKGSHERQIAIETAKAMIEELSTAKAPATDATQELINMQDDII